MELTNRYEAQNCQTSKRTGAAISDKFSLHLIYDQVGRISRGELAHYGLMIVECDGAFLQPVFWLCLLLWKIHCHAEEPHLAETEVEVGLW